MSYIPDHEFDNDMLVKEDKLSDRIHHTCLMLPVWQHSTEVYDKNFRHWDYQQYLLQTGAPFKSEHTIQKQM
jgi:hypothetical protein